MSLKVSSFPRINPVAESILKILEERNANPENLAFVLRCEEKVIGENLKFLLLEDYVINTNNEHLKASTVYPRDNYRITVYGRNYLSSVKLVYVRDRRQFIINVVNASVALTALVKAFWNEISATLQSLTQ